MTKKLEDGYSGFGSFATYEHAYGEMHKAHPEDPTSRPYLEQSLRSIRQDIANEETETTLEDSIVREAFARALVFELHPAYGEFLNFLHEHLDGREWMIDDMRGVDGWTDEAMDLAKVTLLVTALAASLAAHSIPVEALARVDKRLLSSTEEQLTEFFHVAVRHLLTAIPPEVLAKGMIENILRQAEKPAKEDTVQ